MATKKKKPLAISRSMLQRAKERAANRKYADPHELFAPYKPPPGVIPDEERLAMDIAPQAWAGNTLVPASLGISFEEGQRFMGYPELTVLAQRTEYRRVSEAISTDMTRAWIELKSKSEDGSKADKIKKITDAMEKLEVQDKFRQVALHDGFFGRSHIFLDFDGKGDTPRSELMLDIGDGRSDLSKSKCGKKKPLLNLSVIEPIWIYPAVYNASDPTKPDFYRPESWYMMNKQTHRTRLLPFVGRPVGDLLKPAYAFGGLSLTQMVKPYVDNWLRTRQSVADIISSFTVFVLLTNLASQLAPEAGGTSLFDRIDIFNNIRDNRGLMAIDKDLEDFKNVSASLSTLDALQAQSLEHICSASGLPVVKFTGIQPTGLNADSEGVMRAFYDWIKANQELLFRPHLSTILGFTQLSLFDEVDPDIVFVFKPLREMDEKERGELQKQQSETHKNYIDMGAIDPVEVRQSLADDPYGPYADLDVDDVPEPPENDIDIGGGQVPVKQAA